MAEGIGKHSGMAGGLPLRPVDGLSMAGPAAVESTKSIVAARSTGPRGKQGRGTIAARERSASHSSPGRESAAGASRPSGAPPLERREATSKILNSAAELQNQDARHGGQPADGASGENATGGSPASGSAEPQGGALAGGSGGGKDGGDGPPTGRERRSINEEPLNPDHQKVLDAIDELYQASGGRLLTQPHEYGGPHRAIGETTGESMILLSLGGKLEKLLTADGGYIVSGTGPRPDNPSQVWETLRERLSPDFAIEDAGSEDLQPSERHVAGENDIRWRLTPKDPDTGEPRRKETVSDSTHGLATQTLWEPPTGSGEKPLVRKEPAGEHETRVLQTVLGVYFTKYGHEYDIEPQDIGEGTITDGSVRFVSNHGLPYMIEGSNTAVLLHVTQRSQRDPFQTLQELRQSLERNGFDVAKLSPTELEVDKNPRLIELSQDAAQDVIWRITPQGPGARDQSGGGGPSATPSKGSEDEGERSGRQASPQQPARTKDVYQRTGEEASGAIDPIEGPTAYLEDLYRILKESHGKEASGATVKRDPGSDISPADPTEPGQSPQPIMPTMDDVLQTIRDAVGQMEYSGEAREVEIYLAELLREAGEKGGKQVGQEEGATRSAGAARCEGFFLMDEANILSGDQSGDEGDLLPYAKEPAQPPADAGEGGSDGGRGDGEELPPSSRGESDEGDKSIVFSLRSAAEHPDEIREALAEPGEDRIYLTFWGRFVGTMRRLPEVDAAVAMSDPTGERGEFHMSYEEFMSDPKEILYSLAAQRISGFIHSFHMDDTVIEVTGLGPGELENQWLSRIAERLIEERGITSGSEESSRTQPSTEADSAMSVEQHIDRLITRYMGDHDFGTPQEAEITEETLIRGHALELWTEFKEVARKANSSEEEVDFGDGKIGSKSTATVTDAQGIKWELDIRANITSDNQYDEGSMQASLCKSFADREVNPPPPYFDESGSVFVPHEGPVGIISRYNAVPKGRATYFDRKENNLGAITDTNELLKEFSRILDNN